MTVGVQEGQWVIASINHLDAMCTSQGEPKLALYSTEIEKELGYEAKLYPDPRPL